jgi:cellulase (glycosyl hydrolase family 5)
MELIIVHNGMNLGEKPGKTKKAMTNERMLMFRQSKNTRRIRELGIKCLLFMESLSLANMFFSKKIKIPLVCAVVVAGIHLHAEKSFLFLDLKQEANMGFGDEIAGDGKGGWSDQGPGNDFKDFPFSQKKFAQIPFKVISPSTNGGLSVITFSSEHTSIVKNEAKLTLAALAPFSFLYILHTTCWNKNRVNEDVGEIILKFTDGELKILKVKSVRDVADWWRPEALSNALPIAKTQDEKAVYLSKFPIPGNKRLKELIFKTGGKSVWIIVAATLSNQNIQISGLAKNWKAEAGSKWKKINTADMRVRPGSALDMSQLITHKPAGKYGRVIINKNGKLEFSKRPGKEVRFFECNLNLRCMLEYRFKGEKNIKKLAQMISAQGYNLVRLMGLADYLVSQSLIDERFHKESLNRFDLLIYYLKKNGIYVYLDIASLYRAFHKYNPDKKLENHIKNRIFFDRESRLHWLNGFSMIMLHMNKYTGTRLVDDPVIALLLFYNEQGIRLRRGENLPFFLPAWRTWLKKKYKSIEALQKVRKFRQVNSFEDVPMFSIYKLDKAPCSLQEDVAGFMIDVHDELYQWYVSKARSIGYKGIVTQYDWLHKLINQAIRSKVQAVSMHGYHAHPSYGAYKSVPQQSSISTGGKYFCEIVSARYNGKPFLVTEYGHVFWNKYRYEEGLLFGSYAALQGFDGIGAHSHPVAEKVKRFIFNDPPVDCIFPFQIGSDPIGRASQVVSGFAFAREDVATSENGINISLNRDDLTSGGNSIKALNINQMRLALLTKIGISYSENKSDKLVDKKTSIELRPLNFAKVEEKKWVAHVKDDSASNKQVLEIVKNMKEHNLLSPSNKTSIETGEYQSDTGQIYMAGTKNFLSVISPRLEGACIDVSSLKDEVRLGAVSIAKTSISGSISVISLDKEQLRDSKRILVVYSTDALNSGMTFASNKREKLLKLGTLPVLMRTGILELEIKTNRQATNAWALGLNGKRNDVLPIKQNKGLIVLKVDTAQLASGPTPFFEITLK